MSVFKMLSRVLNIELLVVFTWVLLSPPGVDTDKFKYPIGSGRVTFNNVKSYMKAVSAAFIEIRTNKFSKKVGFQWIDIFVPR